MKARLSLLACVALLVAPAVARSSPTPGAGWTGCRTKPLPRAKPQRVGVLEQLPLHLRTLLRHAVSDKQTESAALLVARRGRVIFREAFGRARPQSIFDLASVTKVVATTTAVMQLLAQSKLRLDEPIGRHIKWLAGTDKAQITVEQLLLHTGGLPSVVYRGALTDDRAVILGRVKRAKLGSRPGIKRRYSDVGFILLGELVRSVTGQRLDAYARRRIFAPLGMCDTGFAPPARLLKRVISPWPGGEKPGQVYDPLSARLESVAGHAGLFSTVDDLARFGQAMLNGGALAGRRVVPRAWLRRFLTPRAVPGSRGERAMGWILDRARPGLGHLSPEAFGHGGFTGTSLWIDPKHQLVVVLLANRTFYEPAKSVRPLRRRVHSLVRAALLSRPRRPLATGLDRLVRSRFAELRGRRIGLITNRTAVDRRGRWIVDLMDAEARAGGPQIVALFAPEHGLGGRVDRHIKDRSYAAPSGRKIPAFSLFGPRRRPNDSTLRGIDTLVFDVAAVGVRYYTYLATMGWAMEEAARRRMRFVVLDRPNPIGATLQGPVAAAGQPQTSTNYFPLPVRYAMTVGELARMYNRERRIGVRLEVITVKGWRRAQRFDRQGLRWVNPSPNIRSWHQALLYAATGWLEGTNLAVGRGTDSPFEWVGAPWIDGAAVARTLNATRLPGVYFIADQRTPRSSRYRGKRCRGVRLLLLDPARFKPVRTGVALALALRRSYPKKWDIARLARMIRHPPTARAISAARRSPQQIERLWAPGLRRFERLRRRYLLYR